MAKKKITATTDNSEWKSPKKRKTRKPMTEDHVQQHQNVLQGQER